MARQITKAQVASVLQQIVLKQQRVCAICQQGFTNYDPACLDHDHTSGYIRGALHRSCNGIEGKMKALAKSSHRGVSSPEYLIGLGKYLERHTAPQTKLIHPQHQTQTQKNQLRNQKAKEARARNKK